MASDSPPEVLQTLVQRKHAFAQSHVIAQLLTDLVRPARSMQHDGGGTLNKALQTLGAARW